MLPNALNLPFYGVQGCAAGPFVCRGRRDIATFAIFRDKSRLLPFSATNRDFCRFPRQIALFVVFRDILRHSKSQNPKFFGLYRLKTKS